MRRVSSDNVNYQLRANEFSVGDIIVPFGSWSTHGRVTSVWPAIGMVDVEFPTGNKRFPVEDLQRIDSQGNAAPPKTNSAPGGQPMVRVPGGPKVSKVVAAYSKQSLYWAGKDRKYRMDKAECDSNVPTCPRCSDAPLYRATYKRREGQSEKLMGCKVCLFLIKDLDIVNFNGLGQELMAKTEKKSALEVSNKRKV